MSVGVVLDLDDTLFLERDYVRSGFRHLDTWCERELRVSGVGAAAWDLFEAGQRGTTITDALAGLGVPVTPALAARVVAEYREHTPDIEPLADALAFLRFARSVGARLAVVTDGPAASQRAKARAMKTDDWADRVVVTAELGRSKPDPAVFEAAVETWDLPARLIVYIGDNPMKDFHGPAQLGWRSLRVRRAGSLHQSVPTPPWAAERPNLCDGSGIIDWIANDQLPTGQAESWKERSAN